VASVGLSALLLVGILVLATNTQSARAYETIHIRADGSVDPSEAPISTSDNITYTFTQNSSGFCIVIERDNIVVDGAGYFLQGTGGGAGMNATGRTNVTIQNMNIDNFGFGIYLKKSDKIDLIWNSMTNGGYGIYVYVCLNCTFSGNNIVANQEGIWFVATSAYPHYNTISENNITANKANGIAIGYSNWCTIVGNNVTNNVKAGISLASYSEYNNVSANNLIANTGYNIYVSNHAEYNRIYGNYVEDSPNEGIGLDLALYNIICENIITENKDAGICIVNDSAYNAIYRNDIRCNANAGIDITNCSRPNYIYGNNITRSSDGITLWHSDSNVIHENNLTSNYNSGVSIFWGENNAIYHNNFLNNTPQQAQAEAYVIKWDDGYPSGGNYWSNYIGVDLHHGPSHNIPGSDGIGDTPYTPYASNPNQDRYPLMNPYPGSDGPHDLEITSMKTSKTIVGQGFDLLINTTVLNRGEYTENSEAVMHASTTNIGTNTLCNMLNGTSIELIFTWNTTDFDKGNCTITAYVTQVLGEMDLTDNCFVCGVYVGIPGDVDGNGIVNMFDLYYVASHFGASIGQPEYIANYDVDSNSIINMLDLWITARHFGERYP